MLQSHQPTGRHDHRRTAQRVTISMRYGKSKTFGELRRFDVGIHHIFIDDDVCRHTRRQRNRERTGQQ